MINKFDNVKAMNGKKKASFYKSRFILSIVVAILTISSLFFVVSCGNGSDSTEPMTDIGAVGMEFVNGTFKTTVDTDVDNYDLDSKLVVAEGATIIYSKSEDFLTTVNGRSIELNPGDNLVFAKVIDSNGFEKVHKVNVYRKQIFTITFDTNGGTVIEPVQVKEGTALIAPPQTVKSGYTFVKWSYDFSKPISASQTVKAEWKANQYEISISNGIDSSKTVTYGENYSLEDQIPSQRGYRFLGWVRIYEENGTTIKVPFDTTGQFNFASNIKVDAVLEPIEYLINYVVAPGATNNNTTKFTVESVVDLLDAEWKDDEKRFVGWYTSEDYAESSKISTISNIAEPITLWAKFEDVIFTSNVTCNVDAQYVDSAISNTYIFTYKSPYSLFVPVAKKGYVFKGWQYKGEKIDLEGVWSYKYENDMTIEAVFEATNNSINYILPSEEIDNSINPNNYTIEDGKVVLEAPKFGNHIFGGWYTDPDFTNPITELNIDTVSEQMTIYSKWTYVSSVQFEVDGEVVDELSETYIFGEDCELPRPTKAGSYFVGWYYGDTLVTSGVWKYKEDVVLVANWVASTYAINYVINGNAQNVENPNPASFDLYAEAIQLQNPKMGNAIFEGWYSDSQYQNLVTEIDTSIIGNVTLYAKWKTVTVIYDTNGGSITNNSQNIIYGAQYVLTTPEMLGYEFKGWYLNGEKIALSGTWEILDSPQTLVAKWSIVKYTISYDTGAFKFENLETEFTVDKEIVLPVLSQEGYIFLGWEYNGVISRNIVIPKGSTGDRLYVAKWTTNKDSKGFVYELVDDHMVCVKYARPVDGTQIIYMPSQYEGYPVTAIRTNAFTEFGEAFGKSEYKNQSYYYTICIPQSITVIETDAFDKCNGICISLYRNEDKSLIDSTKTDDLNELLAWESNVSYSTGKSNKQVRDCIWGFRPAIGWSRYSAVVIPDYYE